jgi:hypothetical protein
MAHSVYLSNKAREMFTNFSSKINQNSINLSLGNVHLSYNFWNNTDKQTNKQIHKQTQIQTRMKTSGAGKNAVGCHEIETAEANNF